MKFKSLFLLVFLAINISVFAYEPGQIKIGAVDNPNDFQFVVMGDRHGGEQKGVFDDIVVKVNTLCPAFVLNVGDNIAGYSTDANAIQKMWDIYDESLKKLNVPYLKVAGNHDITNEIEAKIYEQRFGSAYYFSIYKNVLFLFVNTDDPTAEIDPKVQQELNKEKQALKEMAKTQGVTPQGLIKLQQYEEKHRNLDGAKITDAQFEFFKKVLADNNNVRWTFVIMHKPVWKQTSPPANWVKLEELLKTRPYTVFAGHEHVNSYASRNNRDYIVMSTCGGVMPKGLNGVYHHLLLVNVNGSQPTISNLMADGIVAKNKIPVNDINNLDVKKLVEEYTGTAKK
ncbi:MAG: metallophosphoesterase [Phycisphaerales bacterium]